MAKHELPPARTVGEASYGQPEKIAKIEILPG